MMDGPYEAGDVSAFYKEREGLEGSRLTWSTFCLPSIISEMSEPLHVNMLLMTNSSFSAFRPAEGKSLSKRNAHVNRSLLLK